MTTAIRIQPDRLARLQTITLDAGKHSPNGTYCVMEFAAFLANERWSDAPECVSPVIAAFARNWNDCLDVESRNRLLKPLVVDMIGTRTTAADEETRAWMATDWLARIHTPAWLRLAGLTSHAIALESCARIVDAATARAAQPRLDGALQASAAARDAARDAASAAAWVAARDAARAAAWAAAWDAAWDAARDAARDAASAAAWVAARDAAWAAAWDAARDAARAALNPTVNALQESAVELVRAMCAVGRVEVVVAEQPLSRWPAFGVAVINAEGGGQ
jgi:hypothetical protein